MALGVHCNVYRYRGYRGHSCFQGRMGVGWPWMLHETKRGFQHRLESLPRSSCPYCPLSHFHSGPQHLVSVRLTSRGSRPFAHPMLVSFLFPLCSAFRMSRPLRPSHTIPSLSFSLEPHCPPSPCPKASGYMACLYYVALFALNHQHICTHLCPFKR